MFHSRFGRKSRNASSPASTSQRLNRCLRCGSEHEPGDQTEAEDQHGVLGFQTEAGDQSEPEPEFLVAGIDDADEDERAPHPAERLEGVDVEEMIQRQDAGSEQDAEGGEPLGKAASAQFARDGSGEQHQAGAGDRGSQADGRERTAEQRELDAADEGDHRGHIHVSPGEMAGEREVVQLVDEVAVVAARVEVEDQFEGGDGGHQHSGSELPANARFAAPSYSR